MNDDSDVIRALQAIALAMIAHCHVADRPGSDDFCIEKRRCAACRVLGAALGLEGK